MTNLEVKEIESVLVHLETALEWLNEKKEIDIETTAKIAHAIGQLEGLLELADHEAITQAQDVEERGDDSGKFEAEVEK